MKNLLLAIALLIFTHGFAQKEKMKDLPPAEKTQKYIKKWTKELSLNTEQQTKAQPIILEMFTKMAQLRADSTMEKRTKVMSMKQVRNTATTQFKALLTPDQSALYDKRMQEMKQKAKSQNGKGKGGDNGMRKAAEDELENDDIF